MMYRYRGPIPNQERFFFGAPLLGGFVGGLLGSALIRPRPYYPYPPAPYPPYGGRPPVPYGYYGGPGGPYGPYGY